MWASSAKDTSIHFSYFSENGDYYFMKIFSLGDNMHEMSTFLEKKIRMLSDENFSRQVCPHSCSALFIA